MAMAAPLPSPEEQPVEAQQPATPAPPPEPSALESYTQDLTAMAREGQLDPVVGRDREIRQVVQVLSRRTKNNPVLVGAAGVGKTALIQGLAQRIVAGKVADSLSRAAPPGPGDRQPDRWRQIPRPIRGTPAGRPGGGSHC